MISGDGVSVVVVGTKGSGIDAVLHAIALALQNDGLGVMEEAVEDDGGKGAVVVEDGGPLFEDLDGVDKFALLILSEVDGAMVREASPPKR